MDIQVAQGWAPSLDELFFLCTILLCYFVILLVFICKYIPFWFQKYVQFSCTLEQSNYDVQYEFQKLCSILSTLLVKNEIVGYNFYIFFKIFSDDTNNFSYFLHILLGNYYTIRIVIKNRFPLKQFNIPRESSKILRQ